MKNNWCIPFVMVVYVITFPQCTKEVHCVNSTCHKVIAASAHKKSLIMQEITKRGTQELKLAIKPFPCYYNPVSMYTKCYPHSKFLSM